MKKLIIQGSNLSEKELVERLVDFEKVSWPKGERANKKILIRRVKDFSEGIFILSVNHSDNLYEDVAQITLAPKEISDLTKIKSFKHMRDLPVFKESNALWVTNLAAKMGDKYRDNNYATEITTKALKWAIKNGYDYCITGVTCYGFHEAHLAKKVSSIEDYQSKNMNPALKTFRQAAKNIQRPIKNFKPIKNYWPEDKESEGYGVIIIIDLKHIRVKKKLKSNNKTK